MNPAALFRLQGAWNTFTRNHPKFPAFLQAVQKADIGVGTVAELKITTQEGRLLQTNVRLTESDLELIHTLQGMGNQG